MKKNSFISMALFMKVAVFVLLFVINSAFLAAQAVQSHCTVVTPGTPFFAASSGWYQVTVPAGRLTVYTTGSSDTEIRLYDSSARRIAYDDDSGTDYNARVSVSVSAGTFFIGVSYADDDDNAYTLHVER
jgi:hypothetical protein